MKNEIIKGEFNIALLQQEYLSYIDVAPKTVKTYDIALKQFGKYLCSNNIKKPRREDVIAFRESLKENNKSISTINSYLIALRNFFKFLSYNGLYKDITENVKGLKDTDLHKREALNIETCQKLYENAKDLKEKVLLSLMLSCGLRVNEVANIQIKDFKFENDQYRLYVLGKGRAYKQDFVVIPNDLLEMLKEYVKEYEIKDYLFVSSSNHNKGGKVTPTTITRMINAMYERIGIKSETIVAHSLRHSFATISIENGQDIREVSHALRHRSLTVTERYLHDLEFKNNKCSNLVFNVIKGG